MYTVRMVTTLCFVMNLRMGGEGLTLHTSTIVTIVQMGAVKKYGGKGESPEHLQAKLWFGRQPRVVFRVECEQVCGNVVRTVEVQKEWNYKTEQRLTMTTDGKYIWADGAFIDESGVVQLVVEVKHTHGTTGDKLKWLQNQTFDFFEVDVKDVQESHNGVVPIINQKNDHRLCRVTNV